MLTSPNSAASIFNPDGPHPIRQKHAFVVRFLRDPAADASSWREGLTFVVKTIDRPSVQPVVEEINQYNRKRLIHTGVKYGPINCTLYDTADGAAMNMWVEYARYYFGDYRLDPTAYADDILNSQINTGPFADNAGASIQPESVNFPMGLNSQYFFTKIIVYQVWGNEYTSYELINPRINSFNPDELTYEDGGAASISMTLQYEAVFHGNRGRPQDLFSDATLEAIFADGPFNGQTIQVEGPAKQAGFAGTAKAAKANGNTPGSITTIRNTAPPVARTSSESEGGVLARFGNFSFGNPITEPRSSSTDLDTRQFRAGEAFSNNRLVNFDKTDDAVYSAVGEQALNIAGLARALNVAATDLGGAPMDQVNKTNGLRLSDRAVAAFNDQQDGTFLGGVKKG
jgi:hypothetical protein